MTDEKILKKIGKLLKMYGASDEEAQKFLIDIEDTKYDDEEEAEVPNEKQVDEEKVEVKEETAEVANKKGGKKQQKKKQ